MSVMEQAEILDLARWLENESITHALREQNKKYHDIYQLTEQPRLAEELTRGRTVVQPSSFIHKLSSSIISQVTGYNTSPVFTALGGLTDTEADDLEAYGALLLADWNEGQQFLRRLYRALLNNSHAVLELKTGDPSETMPCQLTIPRNNTVFFPDFDAPGRPAVAARRFRMLIPDAVKEYSGRKGDYEGAGQQLVLADGKTSWQALSGERSVSEGYRMTNGNGQAQEVEITRVWKGGMVYDTLKNLNGSKEPARLVYSGKTVTDGVPLVVVPGFVGDEDNPAENWRPILWPAYNDTLQINRMRAVQATRSERVMPHVFAQMTPELQAATRKEGLAPLPQMLPGGPNIQRIYANDIVMWEPQQDPQMEYREQRIINERDQYAASWQLTVTPEMVTNGTRGANELHSQAVHQRETELLLPAAYGLAEGLRMAFCALANYDEPGGFSIAAKDAIEYGDSQRIDKGTVISLKRETLRKLKVYGPKANVNIRVVTRSETEQELTAREMGVANNVARGISTFPELIAVRYANVAKQKRAIAKDDSRKQLAAKYDTLLDEYATGRAQMRFGEMWPGGGPAPAANVAAAPAGNGGGGITPPVQGTSFADTQPGVADAMGGGR